MGNTKNITFNSYFILTLILSSEAFLINGDKNIENVDLITDINPGSLFDKNVEIKPVNTGPIPDRFNWRDHVTLSPVKAQGNCSACWAFSIAACIESHLKIHLNQEELISEQHLIDCVAPDCGCTNCSILNVWGTIVTKFGGVARSQDYRPYNEKHQFCTKEKLDSPVPVTGLRRVLPDENVMAEYVYRYGPLVVAINSESMKIYTGGIDEPTVKRCPPTQLDHTVLIVGYNYYVSEDFKTVVPYWIIKNSWGEGWGDNGYYYLVRGRNACGITSDVSFGYVN